MNERSLGVIIGLLPLLVATFSLYAFLSANHWIKHLTFAIITLVTLLIWVKGSYDAYLHQQEEEGVLSK